MIKWDSKKEEPMRICTECKGKGFIEGDECALCMGWGVVWEEEDYTDEYELLEEDFSPGYYDEGGEFEYDNYDDPYDTEHEAP